MLFSFAQRERERERENLEESFRVSSFNFSTSFAQQFFYVRERSVRDRLLLESVEVDFVSFLVTLKIFLKLPLWNFGNLERMLVHIVPRVRVSFFNFLEFPSDFGISNEFPYRVYVRVLNSSWISLKPS